MLIYADTSALLKAVVVEVESRALKREIAAREAFGDAFVSSWLLHTELHCALERRVERADHTVVDLVLSGVELIDVERADLQGAAQRRDRLRAADAIHLVTALRVEAEAMLVYDAELSAAADAAGLTVLAPG